MAISNSILLFTSFYDLIGTAPLGTGKGLKSSVIIILLYLLKELILTGKNKIVICGKKISQKLVSSSYKMIFFVVFFSILMALVLQNFLPIANDFIKMYCDVLFVVVGNGFSWKNITEISSEVKIILIISMLFGKMCMTLFGVSIIEKYSKK
jgi:hypothetical protein